MAEPHSLAVDDTVTHPDWPQGETAKVLRITPFRHIARNAKGRTKLADSTTERVVIIDREMPIMGTDETDDGWMEAGLVKVNA